MIKLIILIAVCSWAIEPIRIYNRAIKPSKETLEETSIQDYVQEITKSLQDPRNPNNLKLISHSRMGQKIQVVNTTAVPHEFYEALGYAYRDHKPIQISPDMIWLLVIQGLSKHIALHAKDYEDTFLSKDSSREVLFRNDDLSPDAPPLLWEKSLQGFVQLTLQKTKHQSTDLILQEFSTTTPTERIVIQSTMLSIMSNYLTYSMMTLCGIPEIQILGTQQDWIQLKKQFEQLTNTFGLKWWQKEVSPILYQFIQVYDGKINYGFWKQIYKYFEAENSGEVDGVNGWITKFIPYRNDQQRSRWNDTLQIDELGQGTVDFRFKWQYFEHEKHMWLKTGFMGIMQDPKSKMLTPKMGWILFEEMQELSGQCVVLLHGLARTSKSFETMESRLRQQGWIVKNLDYPSRQYSVDSLSELVLGKTLNKPEIKSCSQIHFVTHSLGGILVRNYFANHRISNMGRVVMLGPPNQGSEVVDFLKNWSIFQKFNGPAGQELGTDSLSKPKQLGPVSFELGVIAGDRSINWINSLMIPGPDDGKVSVKSTQVSGMKGHLLLHSTHPMIMDNDSAITQTIYFLKHGEFKE